MFRSRESIRKTFYLCYCVSESGKYKEGILFSCQGIWKNWKWHKCSCVPARKILQPASLKFWKWLEFCLSSCWGNLKGFPTLITTSLQLPCVYNFGVHSEKKSYSMVSIYSVDTYRNVVECFRFFAPRILWILAAISLQGKLKQ